VTHLRPRASVEIGVRRRLGRRYRPMARRRCTECRKRFTPHRRASGHQRVCGESCRSRRRNRLARMRRCHDLEEHRADERARQHKHRSAVNGARCHEPASDANSLELLRKLEEIVDKAASLSRATFRRDAMRILGTIGPFRAAEVDRVGGCHELACAPDARGNGSGSVAGVDSVTGGYGSG
jgi:hypothetical protein